RRLPLEARGAGREIAAVVADELAGLAREVNAARILREQRVVDRVRARRGLVAELDRAELVAPAVHRDRIAAEFLVLPREHAERGEVIAEVDVVAERSRRTAEIGERILLV